MGPGSSLSGNEQVSSFTRADGVITGEQAPRTTTSTESILSAQYIILQELQRISQRSGKLEKMAEEDIHILSDFVVGLNRQEKVFDGLLNNSQGGKIHKNI